MNRAVITKWVDTALGRERPQRARLRRQVMAMAVYLGLGAVIWLGVGLGVVQVQPAVWLSVGVLVAQLALYAVTRSGLNQRSAGDPDLYLAQATLALAAGSAAYWAAGPVRGVVLVALVAGLSMAAWVLTLRQARALGALVMVVLGATMAWCAHSEPARFAPREEWLHFLVLAVVLPVVSSLAGPLSEMRGQLLRRKTELRAALAQNRLLAAQDELTGLSNRRHMMTLMMAERGRQQRSGRAMSLVLMDIDFFKHINDSCGHEAGDTVLQIFADVISNGMRAGDALARWGGAEFLLMLPNTTADDALACVERMRAQLAARNFDHVAQRLRVTFSAGIGVCSVDDRMEAIIERADHAMYRAKTDGRNRTVVA